MKIDWKHLSSTKGYISLKAAYIKEARRDGLRDKARYLAIFNWVICRAKHYAHHTGKSLEVILNEWEAGRDYGILNYYQDSRQPKLYIKKLKPIGIKGIRNSYKKYGYGDKQKAKHRMCSIISDNAKKASKKTKRRWAADYKRYQRGL